MDNPLSELISDDIYELLSSYKLLDNKCVRDFQIRTQFKKMRVSGIGASEAITEIKKVHAYLQLDTIRKIVYHINTLQSKEKYKV
jgi:hypothetical protein